MAKILGTHSDFGSTRIEQAASDPSSSGRGAGHAPERTKDPAGA